MRALRFVIGGMAFTTILWMAGCARFQDSGARSETRIEPTERVTQAIEDFASRSFPDSFTSAAMDSDRRTIVLYRVPGSTLDDAISDRFSGTPVRFVDARFTRQQLQALQNRILADRDYWANRGIRLNTVGPAPDGNSVEIGTDSPATAGEALYGRYGRDNISILARGRSSLLPYNGPLPSTPPR